MMKSPLEQFKMKNWLWGWSNMNMTVLMMLVLLWYLTKSNKNLGMGKYELCKWSMYETMKSLVNKELKSNNELYLMLAMFMFMLLNNLMSMMPYSFSLTSQMMGMMGMSNWLWMSNMMLGMKVKGKEFVEMWLPLGTPLLLMPLMLLMELMSYLSKSMSLGLSLSSNMMSGHMLMTMLSELFYKLMKLNKLLWFPSLMLVMMMLLEFSMGMMQAYVFMMLMMSYMKDSLVKHSH